MRGLRQLQRMDDDRQNTRSPPKELPEDVEERGGDVVHLRAARDASDIVLFGHRRRSHRTEVGHRQSRGRLREPDVSGLPLRNRLQVREFELSIYRGGEYEYYNEGK